MKGYLIFSLLLLSTLSSGKINSKSAVVDDITDVKDFKKLLRTKNNVLVLFLATTKENQGTIKVFREAAEAIKGQGTLALFDCSNSEVKKICKKLKVNPDQYVVKHFKDGDFHKDYDRKLAVVSIVNFMRDPTGDLPWEEDPVGADVVHVPDANTLDKFLKRETKPILVMFYAPWCGYCKSLKPEYSAAATELKDKYILAAIDVNRPENSVIRKTYNITGFPTLLYYESGKMRHTFEGENNKAGIVSFMENPTRKTVQKAPEPDWASDTNSEVVHLTSTSFEPALKDEKSVMVMFYATWCGHCKRMKPEYEKAALTMKDENIPGVLAAVNAPVESEITGQYKISGYPTVMYFEYGEFKYNLNLRKAEEIVEFMKDPKEPPPPPPPEAPWEDQASEVIHLTDDTFKTVLKKKKNVLVIFYAPWCGHCKAAKPEFAKAAEHFKDDPKYELAAVDCTRYKETCSAYEVRGYPTIKYFSYLKTVKEYDGGRTEKDFVAYLKGGGESEKKVESPEEAFGTFPGSEHIIQATDDTFDRVLKEHMKVFAFFHASWCGHCKVVKPTISTVAEDLSRMEGGAKVVAIDASVNSNVAKRFNINGFPTFKMFIDGEFVSDFAGERSRAGFTDYIKRDGQNTKEEL
ncbi:protein disulfide-isomerase A5 [Phlebotomus argentipes]|uniref:protein disulfide-isomerase A5 n=1 Tax=Phlebotomus argentipes TaxID=94469 RepID=UPI002893093C|nr:protein disulfide-isomerase A5 [Phlebotomus argentipes]